MTGDFHGAKIALLCGDRLVAYLRDDKPGIHHPGNWDLPGGGREGEETPRETVIRETEEEFGIRLAPDSIAYARRYPSQDAPGCWSWFLAGCVTPQEVAAIRFGDEGQRWEMMRATDFLVHDNAVPYLRERLGHYLAESHA